MSTTHNRPTPEDTTAGATELPVDAEALRADVREKYGAVAVDPDGAYHFQTGRPLAERLGYPAEILDALRDEAIASFAGVANPFSAGPIPSGATVLDLGSGGGSDCFVAAALVGPAGRVIGVDMTPEMIDRSRRVAQEDGVANVEFREGILEDLPVRDASVDVVISNGVVNLVADKRRVFAEAFRVLRPGGVIQLADIAVGREVPYEAQCDIELWTDCIAGGRSVDEWCGLLGDAGFTALSVGLPVDTFDGTRGMDRARSYEVFAHVFQARKP
jgi:SAM-dependent methyltransferase